MLTARLPELKGGGGRRSAALAGLEFYQKVVELQARYAGAKRVRNDFQTDGLLLDEAWWEFFQEARPEHRRKQMGIEECRSGRPNPA